MAQPFYHGPQMPQEPLRGEFTMKRPLPEGFPLAEDSALRQVVAEPVLFLTFHRALIEEVAHPQVAAAVSEHSVATERPKGRFTRTGGGVLRLIYGTGDEARQAMKRIYGVHNGINGAMPEGGGPWEQGDRYDAHDAYNLCYVWGTLVDTFEETQAFVKPFSEMPERHDSFYDDCKKLARVIGIPEQLIPPTRQDFREYFDGMITGGVLGSTETSQEMVHKFLNLEGMVPKPVARLLKGSTATTLDPRMRDALNIGLSRKERRRAERIDGFLRRNYSRLPEGRRKLPYALLEVARHGDRRRAAQELATFDGFPP